jgi:hypothetical protein
MPWIEQLQIYVPNLQPVAIVLALMLLGVRLGRSAQDDTRNRRERDAATGRDRVS